MPGTTIALLKSVVDVLNRDFHDGPSVFNMKGEMGHGTYSVFPGDQDVRSINCYRNMCALMKKSGDEFIEHRTNGCVAKGKNRR